MFTVCFQTKMKLTAQRACLSCLLLYPMPGTKLVLDTYFWLMNDGMNEWYASLSSGLRCALALTEMSDIEDISLPPLRQDHQGLCSSNRTLSSTCAFRQAPPGHWEASYGPAVVFWHVLISLFLSMLLAGCRALMIKSVNLLRAQLDPYQLDHVPTRWAAH